MWILGLKGLIDFKLLRNRMKHPLRVSKMISYSERDLIGGSVAG